MVYLNMKSIDLLRWRKKQGYTQTELAKLLGTTKTTIYRWEKNMREIPPFLHLALKWLEYEGGELKGEGKKRERR